MLFEQQNLQLKPMSNQSEIMKEVNLESTAEEGQDLMGRRNFITAVVGVVGACYAAAIGYPVYRYLASPVEQALSAGAVKEVVLPKEALDLPKNSSLMFKFGTQPALLIRHEDGSYTAMSAICTHLGCTVSYEVEQKRVFCPCHSGVYDAQSGKNVAGPPPKPLELFEVELQDGQIIVRRS